uniref:Uncharacterized protein n=1 Tax=Anguilla anguilla TaxID=7936 RepID=A0A0E9RXM1_ANGAN
MVQLYDIPHTRQDQGYCIPTVPPQLLSHSVKPMHSLSQSFEVSVPIKKEKRVHQSIDC